MFAHADADDVVWVCDAELVDDRLRDDDFLLDDDEEPLDVEVDIGSGTAAGLPAEVRRGGARVPFYL